MTIYSITYYLKEEESQCGCGDHEHHHTSDSKLIGKIKSLGAWAHFMPTSFLLNTSMSSSEILENLKEVVNEKDLLFISKVDSKTCACLTPEVLNWISNKEAK